MIPKPEFAKRVFEMYARDEVVFSSDSGRAWISILISSVLADSESEPMTENSLPLRMR